MKTQNQRSGEWIDVAKSTESPSAWQMISTRRKHGGKGGAEGSFEKASVISGATGS